MKPKGPEGLAAKTKKKVEEVAAKAKDAVTNGHHEEGKHETAETAAPEPSEPAAESSVEHEQAPVEAKESAPAVDEPVRDASAGAQNESAAVESEAPKAQEEAVF